MLERVRGAMGRNSYCTLATSSAGGRPHVVGVLYALAGARLYVVTKEDSRKVRNVRANPRVAVCVPVRRYPFVPPSSVQLRGNARVLPREDEGIAALLREGRLKRIVGHGVLDQPGMCFLEIEPSGKVHTWGIGVSLWSLVRDPVGADRAVDWA